MAIFHLRHSFLRRSNGSSSIATAAYNSGEKLEDNAGSTAYSDYTRKGGVLYDEISLPSGSPAWANNRGDLWRRLEAREDRSTRPQQALLAHNFNIALPHELTLEQNIFLARDFIREQFTRKGYAVDWAIHAPDPRGDSRNIHLHILVPLRKIEGNGFGKKDRYTRNQLRQQVTGWRKSWANLVNRHLKRYGHKVTVDERSLKAQGIKRTPTRHRGPRPRTKRAILNAIRAKQPPQPRSPVIKTTRQTGSDGSISLRNVIRHSALNKIGSRIDSGNNSFVPAARSVPPASHPALAVRAGNHAVSASAPIPNATATAKTSRGGGWPPEAIADWKAWGHRDPASFFAKWPQLGTSNISPGGLNR